MDGFFELSPRDLKKECDVSLFGFDRTDQVSCDKVILGQDRAIKAIDFGLNLEDDWFNLYISGPAGTGRNTTIIEAVNRLARSKTPPEDICFLNNFEKPDEPKFLKVPAGRGCGLKQDLDDFIKDLGSGIRKAFSSEDYEKHKKDIIEKFDKERQALELELEDFVKEKGFTVQQTLTGFIVIPVFKGHALTGPQYDKLSEEERQNIKAKQDEVDNKLFENSRKIKEFQRKLKEEVQKLDKDIGLYSIGNLIEDLKKKYSDSEEIRSHIESIKDDIFKNLDAFKKEPESRENPFLPDASAKEQEAILSKYRVNLVVDNCRSKGAPVVIESNPTYYNLTGYVEYKAQFGLLTTDFTMIKAGSILKANGGYLIVQANQILRDYFAWDSLKKVIRYKKVKIENIAEQYGLIPTTGLKPQAVPVDMKVIIVGSPYIYHLLYAYDEDFSKFFKVRADFDTSIKRSDTALKDYALFIARKSKDDNLLPFTKEAVGRIIDYSSRLVSHKDKLSIRFLEIAELMKQSDFWSRKDNHSQVEISHVKKAIDEKVYRSSMVEEKIRDLFEENTLFVDTSGAEIGQINGISVINTGDYAFGMPSRITASTFAGRGNILNIEREAKLSGKIHSKGVFILSGYLGSKFAQDKPLSLSASICFEQVYEEVEGDSASSTELYCLLSSLSELPLRQDIAVTGSVNQRGRIQPVGGINEKIEGFYEVCRIKGLKGTEAVIIPRANIKNLMLKDEVVDAVRDGKFHVYPVDSVEEGIEILTGKKYPEIFDKINDKLRAYARLSYKERAANGKD